MWECRFLSSVLRTRSMHFVSFSKCAAACFEASTLGAKEKAWLLVCMHSVNFHIVFSPYESFFGHGSLPSICIRKLQNMHDLFGVPSMFLPAQGSSKGGTGEFAWAICSWALIF